MAGEVQQIYQPSEKSMFLDLLDTEKFLNAYEHQLRGEVLVTRVAKNEAGMDTARQEYERRYDPKMTEQGINSVMSFLRMVCDKSLSMTDLSEELIDTLIKQNADVWLDFLCANFREFGLSSPTKINEIYYPGKNLIITKFRSAVDGMTVNAISTTTNVNENRNTTTPEMPQEGPGKPGFLSKLGIKV